MQREISKLCADSLRTLANEKYGTKLKSAHAHELVAAYFGYRSKNALLADENYPISALAQAEIVVTMPDEFFNKRRMDLQELSSDLPDNSVLYEAIHSALVSSKWLRSPFPPFRDFETLAKPLVANNHAYQNVFRFYRKIPMQHIVRIESEEEFVLLTVIHAHQASEDEMLAAGKTTINLPRVAGRIGYGKPQVDVEKWTGGARRTLKSSELRS